MSTHDTAGIYYRVGDIEYMLDADGSLTIYTARRDEALGKMRPEDVYSLYLFLAKLPHVGDQLERLEAQRQARFFARMASDDAQRAAEIAIINAERRRVEYQIRNRNQHKPNESPIDFLKVEVAQAQDMVSYYTMIDQAERLTFWRAELASAQRQLDEELADGDQANDQAGGAGPQ